MDSKNDRHPLDKFLPILASRSVMMTVVFLTFILGIYLAVRQSDWQWVSRFGAIQSICGLLLTMASVFKRGIYKSQSGAFGFSELDEEGNTQVTDQDDREIGQTVAIGIVITIIGTLINAFGDLIGRMLTQC